MRAANIVLLLLLGPLLMPPHARPDVCSNWGNWCAAAGMTGGRVNKFNITKQSKVGGLFQAAAHRAALLSGEDW